MSAENFYTNAVQYGNNILLRGIRDGERVQYKIPFSPTLFVKAKIAEKESKYKSIHGESLEPIKFDSINDAYDFLKQYQDVDGFDIFGNSNFAYQFISKVYKQDIDFDLSKIRIATIDIETTADEGFPSPKNPVEEVLLISLQDYRTKEIVTYGCQPYKPNKTRYIRCSDERDLLTRFIADFRKLQPDVITGWNCEFFDIAYLLARVRYIFGEAFIKTFSPWNVVKEREVFRMNQNKDITFNIYGIAVLDYLDLYKKFTYNAQESYKLDHIAKVELGASKHSYDEFDSFKDFYTKDWQRFVDYNIQDVRLVDALEEKMRLIELIITMAYRAKSNFADIFSAVRTWDCLLYNHLIQKNIIVPQPVKSDSTYTIEGGYVKEPVPGKYYWIVSIDAASLYPSIMMQYNMSPETLTDLVFSVKKNDFLGGEYDLSKAIEENVAVTANGHTFKRDKQGFFPEIVESIFMDRQKYKKLMLQATKDYEETKDPKYLNDISRYNNRQMASKILLNSLFGACANKYFRFFDNRIAEGITLTGQLIIQKVVIAINEYFNKACETEGVEYAFYADTDSCYITLENLRVKYFKDKTKEQTIDIINTICEEQITKVVNKACRKLSDYTNAFDPTKVYFKREAISDSGIWVAKKRYALNVFDNEGVRYKEPKLKVMGLEIVRSSTPEVVRKSLKEAVRIALTGDEQNLQDYIVKVEQEFRSLPLEDISFPRSVNGISKYASTSTIYTKGTPIHVRGSLLYNNLLKKYKLEKKYESIKEGDKIKFVYLREPNTLREDCIAYISALPKDFELHSYIDYDLMFQKTFLDPMMTILNCIGWESKPSATLEGLFE
jgi:DNA polymerase elongation subunit (family B)